MQQWEYLVAQTTYDADFEERGVLEVESVNGQRLPQPSSLTGYLRSLGAQGWEMTGVAVVIDAPVLFFKRPLANGTSQARDPGSA